MKYDSTCIHNPSAQPALQRTAWGFVTAAFWLFYLHLLMPLVTLVLWAMGIRTVFSELYLRESHIEPFLVFVLPVLACACAALLIGWAGYNRARFGGVERRQRATNVSRDDIALALGANALVSAGLAEAKIGVLHMDERAIPVALSRQMR